ncbi:endoglucanase E-4-like [Cloeon dipterum]|uniref:endoglucanase E-4-like n=1 Tax=Cloeon dipterum TaxID=197152 RepID=UPI003220A025
MLILLIPILLLSTFVNGQQSLQPCTQLISSSSHQNNIFRAKLSVPSIRNENRWQATIKFTRPVAEFSVKNATFSSADMRSFVLRGGPLAANSVLVLNFQTRYTGPSSTLSIESVHFDGKLVCKETIEVTPTNPRIQTPQRKQLKYDYKTVIHNSLLFYEAQRSGLLPEDNRIRWRNDSCVRDRGNGFESLIGGYYTNGRTLKFTFPTAATMTVLAWGILNNEDGYARADELALAKDALHWGTLYLEKCHTKPEEIYALVGDVDKEIREWWGRPEDINFHRPAYSVTPNNPGSELAAEAAAALAASSILLGEDPARKNSHMRHAKELYSFATNYRGDYSKAVPLVAEFYRSWSGDEDELVWASLWLYRATGDRTYLDNATRMYHNFRLSTKQVSEFSWDDKTLGARILLALFTLDEQYAREAEAVCDNVARNSSLRNPQGLYHINQAVGAIRYAANIAYACYELGEVLITIRDIPTNPYIQFAIQQVNFILGDSGRSFMVGFGNNYPRKIQHSASSCPNIPQECGWKNKNAPGPNPQVLVGALVGGPDINGRYEDSRDNWSQNDVGIDYNAGFQSLVAALYSLHHQNKLPNEAYLNNY